MTYHTTDLPGTHLSWAGKRVQSTAVEETLSHLWHMSADNVRISQNIHVRTSVLNFVICASDLDSAQQASAILRDLSSTHIGRVVLLILDSNASAPAGVSTWVTLRSFPIVSDVMRHHFEQITVMVSGSAIASSPHIIQPYLKPDLPIYMWWLHDPLTQQTVLEDLVKLSNRVIMDSYSFFQPAKSIRTLASLLQDIPECAMSDLNWGRITPWRQLVAQFFDVPEYKPYLAGVYAIEVEYAVSQAMQNDANGGQAGQELTVNPTRALFLAGWLKTTLNWHVDTSDAFQHDSTTGTFSWRLTRETGPLHLEAMTDLTASDTLEEIGRSGHGSIVIRPRAQSDLAPGSLCLIRLTSNFENKKAAFNIDREHDADHVLTSVDMSDNTRPPRTVIIGGSQEVSTLLHDELEILGRDYLYEDALHAVLELLQS